MLGSTVLFISQEHHQRKMSTEVLTLSNGRLIAWYECGDVNSILPPIFVFHSFPGSRLGAKLWHDPALKYGLRIISPDRPGVGLSTHDPHRTLLSYPADILELADYLQIPQFKVFGSGEGGPYVLACLKVLPKDRCIGGQIVSGIYPFKLWTCGMAWDRRILIAWMYWMPGFFGSMIDRRFGKAARNPDPQVFKELIVRSFETLPEPDKKAMEDEAFVEIIVEAKREAFREGRDGISKEASLYTSGWGFKLEDVECRDLGIWHGKLDANVPFHIAQKAAGLLHRTETRFFDDEGHNVVMKHRDEILQRFLTK